MVVGAMPVVLVLDLGKDLVLVLDLGHCDGIAPRIESLVSASTGGLGFPHLARAAFRAASDRVSWPAMYG